MSLFEWSLIDVVCCMIKVLFYELVCFNYLEIEVGKIYVEFSDIVFVIWFLIEFRDLIWVWYMVGLVDLLICDEV